MKKEKIEIRNRKERKIGATKESKIIKIEIKINKYIKTKVKIKEKAFEIERNRCRGRT